LVAAQIAVARDTGISTFDTRVPFLTTRGQANPQ
jgi:hypothetical protein